MGPKLRRGEGDPANESGYSGRMAKRRWMDGSIAARMAGGLALMAIPALCWMQGWMTKNAWIAGMLGLGLFCWGLFSIGDPVSEWENDYD